MTGDIEIPASGLVDVELAARIAHVQPGTIRQWKKRGHLDYAVDVDGRPFRDARGRQLFNVVDVAEVEYRLRAHARRPAVKYA